MGLKKTLWYQNYNYLKIIEHIIICETLSGLKQTLSYQNYVISKSWSKNKVISWKKVKFKYHI